VEDALVGEDYAMTQNYVEELVSEYYEYQDYFVRRNVQVGPRARGGYECELDVVAFHPERNHLVQIEPSMDADTWPERERRYEKKFCAGRNYVPDLFRGLTVAAELEQIAIFIGGHSRENRTLCGGHIVYLWEFLGDALKLLKDKHVLRSAVPEQYPILRTLQLVSNYHERLFGA
jgi:hypothetical protein